MPRRALLLLVVVTLAWGTSWPLFTHAVREVSVFTFRAVSTGIVGVVLLSIARLRGQSIVVPRASWPVLVVAGLCYLGLWNVATTWSAVLLPSGQAAVIGFTMPLWAALISWLVLREPLGPRLVAAVALGALAVTLLMVPSFHRYADAPLGLGLGLFAAIGWAVGTLLIKHARPPVPVLVLTGWQFLVASAPTAVIALAVGEGPWFVPAWQTVAVIAYIVIVPMCIGNTSWFSVVGLLPANVAALSSILVPVVAMLSGAAINGEPLGLVQWLAMACCVGSLSLALLWPRPAR